MSLEAKRRCTKVSYSTRNAAMISLKRQRREQGKLSLRPYLCQAKGCGKWHLGRSQKAFVKYLYSIDLTKI